MVPSPDQIAAAAYHAYESTRFHLRCTPLESADWLRSAMIAAAAAAPAADKGERQPPPPSAVLVKLESEQRSGSFKARGALNKFLSALRRKTGEVAGFTTASTGNHALAVIFAARAAAEKARRAAAGAAPAASATSPPPPELLIYVAENADATKLARLRAAAASLALCGGGRCTVVVVPGADCAGAEAAARRAAGERRGYVYISPYNDAEVIAGQGSLAVELLSQLRASSSSSPSSSSSLRRPPRDEKKDDDGGGADGGSSAAAAGDPPLAVFVPVGGGGLIAGVAAVLKSALGPDGVAVYGCQPAANDVMRRSALEGRLLDLPEVAEAPTLSDATAGGVEPAALTFPLCQQLVDEWVAVEEREVADAVVSTLQHQGKLVEGAAGCALAAALKVARERPGALSGRRVVVVCCGGNVGVAALKEMLEVGRAVDLGGEFGDGAL